MLDPLTTPLLILVLGKLADEIIGDVCKDFLKDKLKGLFSKAEKLGSKDDLQLAYESAMQQAYETCGEILLRNIETFGVARSQLTQYRESLERFIKDRDVAAELFESIKDPNNTAAPSHETLRDRWQAAGGRELPDEQLWLFTAVAYRKQALKQTFLKEPLREILTAQNVDALLKEVVRQGGVKTQVRRDKYSQRMRTKFSPVDLANLMPAYADDPGRMVIRDVFVPQNVRENPPPVEIPKDLVERMASRGRQPADSAGTADDATEGSRLQLAEGEDFDEQRMEKLRTTYVSQSPQPVLDVIAVASNRLLVLTGEPGSGKSTLLRYLLTGIIEPPVNHQSGLPLPWTLAFENAFPLLIELRDFYALRQRDECDNFLEYVAYMGKVDQWFLDDHAVHGYLESGPSLVMFDGLDEIFDAGDRQRVMHEIAGFAERYPRARIIVTSRPVGYKEQVLRAAGFKHFGIQDLDDKQIDSFIRGWFALTFPQQPQQAEQRIERVLTSVRQSKPIRLLAGNPMLLTIMALLAREEELPRERAKFYEKAVEVLCHHWDANRNLQLPEDRYLNADDKKALLRRIAMRMQAGKSGLKGNIIAEDDLEQGIQVYLIDAQWQPTAAEAKKAARRMIQQLRERNYILCLRGPHLYGFVHRTFLEYLTAAEYVRLFDKQPQQMTIDELIELFDKHCRDDEWREVLRLICGQIDEQFVGRIVEHLARRTNLEEWEHDPLPEFPLAIHCLAEVRNLERLSRVGSEVLERCFEVFRRNISGRGGQTAIVDAAIEIGENWPGVREASVSIATVTSSFHWHQEHFVPNSAMYFPSFAAQVLKKRDAIAAMIDFDCAAPYAIQALAKQWPDETTQKLLADLAVQQTSAKIRRAAIQALAENWPDETTRKLLAELAVQEENQYTRVVALQTLAEKWPDAITRKLLAQRARVDGAAASVFGGQHSAFGGKVFIENAEIWGDFLDPREPISREHIELAAKNAGVAEEQIDKTVRSLSEHLGWDITRGSGAS